MLTVENSIHPVQIDPNNLDTIVADAVYKLFKKHEEALTSYQTDIEAVIIIEMNNGKPVLGTKSDNPEVKSLIKKIISENH